MLTMCGWFVVALRDTLLVCCVSRVYNSCTIIISVCDRSQMSVVRTINMTNIHIHVGTHTHTEYSVEIVCNSMLRVCHCLGVAVGRTRARTRGAAEEVRSRGCGGGGARLC